MPNPNITTRYAGEVYEKILAKASTGNELFQQGLIHVFVNVQDSLSIPRMQLSKIMQKRKEMPTSDDSKGNLDIDERLLKPKDAMVYIEFNPRQFEHFWRKWQPTGNLVFEELPANIQSQLLEMIVSQLGEELGEAFITCEYGDGEDQFFDGILTRIAAAEDTVRATCSSTSQKARLRAVWKATDPKIRERKEFVFLMSQADWDEYDDEMTDQHHKGADPTEQNVRKFKGHRVAPLSGMPDGVIIGTLCSPDPNKTNLFAAVNLVDDFNAILIDKVTNAGEKYFCKMLLKADTQIAWDELCTLLDNRETADAGEGSNANEGSSEDPVAPTIKNGARTVTLKATATAVKRTYATSNGADVTAEVEDGVDWLNVSVDHNQVTFTPQAFAYNSEAAANTRSATVTIGIADTDVEIEVTVTQPMAAE